MVRHPDRRGRISVSCQEQRPEAGQQCYEAVDELGIEEAALVFGKQGKCRMSVLGDTAGKQDRQRDKPARIQGHEDEVWPGFRDYSYRYGQKYHQGRIAAYPSADVHISGYEPDQEDDSECPGENIRHMLQNDVPPEGFPDEPVGPEAQDYEHDDAEQGEYQVHPPFAEQIELQAPFLGRRVVVAEPSAGECGCKERCSCSQYNPLPYEAFLPLRLISGVLAFMPMTAMAVSGGGYIRAAVRLSFP